jgi:hypothetical protein
MAIATCQRRDGHQGDFARVGQDLADDHIDGMLAGRWDGRSRQPRVAQPSVAMGLGGSERRADQRQRDAGANRHIRSPSDRHDIQRIPDTVS